MWQSALVMGASGLAKAPERVTAESLKLMYHLRSSACIGIAYIRLQHASVEFRRRGSITGEAEGRLSNQRAKIKYDSLEG
jgi:hypothetical protein